MIQTNNSCQKIISPELNLSLNAIDSIMALDLFLSLNGKNPTESQIQSLIILITKIRQIFTQQMIDEKELDSQVRDTLDEYTNFKDEQFSQAEGISSLLVTNRHLYDYFSKNELQLLNISSLFKELALKNNKYMSINLFRIPKFAWEGIKKHKKHSYRERNQILVRAKKALMKSQKGELCCEACNLNFSDKYGERGEDFIEAHHEKPLFTYKDESKTRLSDLRLLCSNCHSMVHRKIPWLSFEQLKKLINKKQKEIH